MTTSILIFKRSNIFQTGDYYHHGCWQFKQCEREKGCELLMKIDGIVQYSREEKNSFGSEEYRVTSTFIQFATMTSLAR